MRQRGFEIAKGWEDKGIHIPVRKTKHAAGYDVEAAEDVIIPAYKPGIKEVVDLRKVSLWLIVLELLILIIMEMNQMMDIFIFNILILWIMILKLKKGTLLDK